MIWIVMVSAGFATFLMRMSMFSGLIQRPLPPSVDRYLKYVPIAVLSSIIAASIFIEPETHAPTVMNSRVIAGAIAVFVALRTKSVIATIAAGLGCLWVFENLI